MCSRASRYDGGMAMANTIHNSGRAIVWTGPREPAELYWEQLTDAGLTMAPLERRRVSSASRPAPTIS